MKKKDIEKVFREKLENFSQIPEEHVWERVSASLDKKKSKRRILPVWWRIAGVAALLIAGLFLFLPDGDVPNPSESVTETPSVSPADPEPGLMDLENTEDPNNSIVISQEDRVNGQETLNGSQEDTGTENTKGNGLNTAPLKGQTTLARNEPSISGDAMENVESSSRKDAAESEEIALGRAPMAGKENGEKDIKKEVTPEQTVAKNSEKEQAEEVPVPETEKTDEKPSILEAIAAQEEELIEERSGGKWEVGPRVAPVFFSSLAQGSPIHSSFRDNAKSGNVNMSYGVAVSYELAKRLKVRSGVHRVDFGYDTRDVSFSSSLNANTNGIINNIDYNLSSRNLVVRSNTNSGKLDLENAQDVAGPDPSLNGKMVQEFGYLEVPLELTYALVERKVGVSLVGGISSLFLTNNTVVLESNGNTTEMGEANNINDLNFSTNFGIGVSYEINDKLRLNLEPMFKYQLNTFTDTSGNFQPFSMGVYSGLNFRF
ncbi:outer membrane beta-barrel protein [Muriicola marianensis]|nr:outer membrane beta-barrel protein [Muriicola marianensis]